MDSYYFVIALTLVGFLALAGALLIPVYFFLRKEERAAESWTRDAVGRANQEETIESLQDEAENRPIRNGSHPNRSSVA